MNTPSPEVQQAAQELRKALVRHGHAMKYGTYQDTIKTSAEVDAARENLKVVAEREGRAT